MPYIGKKPADIIATVIDTTTGTFSGEVDAGSLDVSGNADIDGITNLDNTDIDGTLDVSGNLTVDTNTLYVDSANNRVGIGTVSPAEKVDIAGNDANAVSLQIVNSETASASVLLGQAGSSGYGVTSWGSSVGILDGTNGLAIGSADPSAPLLFYTSNTRTERARIDSSGNLLVGTTDTNVLANRGFAAKPQGSNNVRVDIGSNYQAMLLSTQNNGAIVSFYKDATAVGSIDSRGGVALSINSQSGNGRLSQGGTAYYEWNTTRFAPVTDTVGDLGRGVNRWKDLYLSGGVYIGGTGSANHLDDYEEGTFVPTIYGQSTAGTPTLSIVVGHYTKIGRIVKIQINIAVTAWSGSPAGELRIGNLPFTPAAGTDSRKYEPLSTWTNHSDYNSYGGYEQFAAWYVQPNDTIIRSNNADASADTNFEVRLSGVYTT